MSWWYEPVTDFAKGAETIRRWRSGVIDCRDGRFHHVGLRLLPKLAAAPDIRLLGNWRHRWWPGDRCLLYYHQPWRFRNFLVLQYIVSSREATLGTLARAMETLDEVARLKQSDAILCDVANWRISDRVMLRCGFEPHCPSRWHRHFIKRMYKDT
ncbi:MAG: hypothetical protein NUV77_23760 [Thermoguttaceae bacterium]|jgi:hypothetical protein|nr:hypothetical protein [Thermoguttaceae bacterium]